MIDAPKPSSKEFGNMPWQEQEKVIGSTKGISNYFKYRKYRQGALWAVPEAMKGNSGKAAAMMRRGFKSGWGEGFGMGIGNWGLMSVMGAASAASAPRGHKLSGFLGPMLAWPIASLVGGVTGIGLPLAIPLSMALDKGITKGMQGFIDFNAQFNTKMGGGYIDTQAAYTMRQQAAQEMSGSLMNARQHLGREARLMHQ